MSKLLEIRVNLSKLLAIRVNLSKLLGIRVRRFQNGTTAVPNVYLVPVTAASTPVAPVA